MSAGITVYFAHGKESGPWGRKIRALAAVAQELGFGVESPDYSFTQDPDERVQHLISLQPPTGRELILVGSSMGGYVAAMASRQLQPAGLFLMAPALYMPGYEGEPEPRADLIEVVHGWRDDLIPAQNSWRFCRAHGARLHVIDSEHTLNDSIGFLESVFARFLRDCDESRSALSDSSA
ncbi:MAG: alpha/beta fold hydrolase [Ectothiorhodospiraceae bacterium]|jgi:pimeloyl-ACP methyl ester carboxylesterase